MTFQGKEQQVQEEGMESGKEITKPQRGARPSTRLISLIPRTSPPVWSGHPHLAAEEAPPVNR